VLTRVANNGLVEGLSTWIRPNKASIRLAKARRDSRGFNWTYSRVLCLGIAGNIVVPVVTPSDIHHIGGWSRRWSCKSRIRVIEHSTR